MPVISDNFKVITCYPRGTDFKLRSAKIQETAPLFVIIDKLGGGNGGFQISTEGKRERLPGKQAITAYVDYRSIRQRLT